MKRKGYLIFTSHDGDEIDATFITDKALFDRLCSDEVKNNDDACKIWEEVSGSDECFKKVNRFFAQAPGNYKWPFNDVKVLGTYYILIY